MKAKGIMIMTDDSNFIKAKHYLISRGKTYKVVYIPVNQEEKQPVIMTEMDLIDRILYKLTFGLKSENVSVFG